MKVRDEGYGASDWLCNIIDQHIKFHPSDDFMDIFNPLILIWQLTHYDSHTALRQYPTPHRVKSSIKSSFHFYPNFPWCHCVSFYYSFLFDLSSVRHAVLKRTFWIFLWLMMSNRYWSLKCCLVVLHSPHYKELSCLRERTIKSGFNLS